MAPGMIEWRRDTKHVDYLDAVSFMEQRVGEIRAGTAPETVWLLEHPPLYTAGTSARPDELLDPGRFPVHRTGRGGQFTYHGPGQRVAYVMLDLQRRGRDIRAYVHALESWLIAALGRFGINGERREGRVGIWIDSGKGDEKIAAIGVRVRRWVTFHGASINLCPDLDHFRGIVPCGISEHGVTSLEALGVRASMTELDDTLRATFDDAFSPMIKGSATAGIPTTREAMPGVA